MTKIRVYLSIFNKENLLIKNKLNIFKRLINFCSKKIYLIFYHLAGNRVKEESGYNFFFFVVIKKSRRVKCNLIVNSLFIVFSAIDTAINFV